MNINTSQNLQKKIIISFTRRPKSAPLVLSFSSPPFSVVNSLCSTTPLGGQALELQFLSEWGVSRSTQCHPLRGHMFRVQPSDSCLRGRGGEGRGGQCDPSASPLHSLHCLCSSRDSKSGEQTSLCLMCPSTVRSPVLPSPVPTDTSSCRKEQGVPMAMSSFTLPRTS